MLTGGGIGATEILLLALLALLLFGSRKLPSLGKSAGKGLREFKDSVKEYKQPVDEMKDLVGVDEIQDIAALRSPRTALTRILKDKPEKDEASTTDS